MLLGQLRPGVSQRNRFPQLKWLSPRVGPLISHGEKVRDLLRARQRIAGHHRVRYRAGRYGDPHGTAAFLGTNGDVAKVAAQLGRAWFARRQRRKPGFGVNAHERQPRVDRIGAEPGMAVSWSFRRAALH